LRPPASPRERESNVSVMMVPANANLLMTPDLLKPTGGQQAQR
jgi:hypothetical protein